MNRLAVGTLPDDHGLALVGDANCSDVTRAGADLPQGLNRAGDLTGEDFERIVFHPSGLRIELLELVLRDCGDAAAFVEEDGAGAGRSLIQCEYVSHVQADFLRDKSNTQARDAASVYTFSAD